MVELSQDDFEARTARVAAGRGDDTDLRLIKLYKMGGFECRSNSTEKSSPATTKSDDAVTSSPPSPAPTTTPPSKRRKAANSTARSTAGPGRSGEYSETDLL